MSTEAGRFFPSNDGTRIWAEEAGNRSGIPVIFIHGLSCTGHAWDKQFTDKTLLANLHMVRYELRGHSRSDYPLAADMYTQEKYADDFMAVCKGFDIKRPFVCGWSLGAATVCDVAQVYGPDIIAGVIFSGGPVMTHDHHRQWIHEDLKNNFPLFLDHDAEKAPHAAHVFVDSCVKYPERVLPYDVRLKWLGGFLMQPPSIREHTFKRPQRWDRWEKEFTRTPHLLIQGHDDKHSHTGRMLPVITKALPEIEVKLIDDIGHAPAFEAADVHNAYLLEFLQRVSGQQTEKTRKVD